MTNHVHILIFVPEAEELSDDEVLSRGRTYKLTRKGKEVAQW